MAAIAYLLLQRVIIRAQGQDSVLKQAVGHDWKGKVSSLLYVAAILVSYGSPRTSDLLLVIAALIWLVPDRRIERRLAS